MERVENVSEPAVAVAEDHHAPSSARRDARQPVPRPARPLLWVLVIATL